MRPIVVFGHALALLLSVLVSPAAARPAEVEEAARQKQAIPEPVWDLFYAIKESLDYGVVESLEAERLPKHRISAYKRVTPGLLRAFSAGYRVERYHVRGSDYELVAASRAHSEQRFKATRSDMFVWENGLWKRVGGYVYL